MLRAEEAPLVAQLRSRGAANIREGRSLPFVIARVSAAQRKALASNPLVAAVVQANSLIPLAAPSASAAPVIKPGSRHSHLRALNSPTTSSAASICGTPTAPENDPEAVDVINATQANALGYDGAGVTVAFIAGGIDTTIPDFQRNPVYASSGSSAGSPVVSSVNFAGDPSTDQGGDASVESFLDASSIGSQGNTVYNLDNYINSSHTLPSPCDITVTGAAPGANVMGLDVFANDYATTESNFIEAIDYAVGHGVKVINESFGSNNFPDNSEDVTRIADDDAVAAGVTVVVSSGDAGVTNTSGSPSTDPNLISAGASTTFRAYEQNFEGGINATTPNASNGTWLNNNISSLSSGGFSQSGDTVDLVAPGDSNWIDCSPATEFGCTDENGNPSGITISGGTSESAPLTAAAAADVIQAYAATHNGRDPSPALIKQILMSTATDIDAPAEQQGAGLLNVLAAVKDATAIGNRNSGPSGLLVSPNQINVVQNPGQQTSQRVSVTNTGSSPVSVQLSTRQFTRQVGNQTGSFCLNPSSSAAGACGPPTANTMQIWSGVTEVYQEETFQVPQTHGASRLNFSADYPDTQQGSLLHVALYDPSGAYAGYSSPQGLADFANFQISDPKAGTWTAVFFTEQDGATAGGTGTTGTIQWQASTYQSTSAGNIWPSTLNIAPGATASAQFTASSSNASGDAAQSIVLSSSTGTTNSIPVTVRTLVPLGWNGGTFSGVLTGGNGRPGEPSQESTYQFQVPRGLQDLDVSAAFADAGDGVIAYLVDPEGETVASSSSVTEDSSGNPIQTNTVNAYKDNPQAGTWYLTLDWLQPVSGSELAEPFQGKIRFDKVNVDSNLPSGRIQLQQGKAYTFNVKVRNTGESPETFFLDPRTNSYAAVQLADVTGSDQGMALPLPTGAPPAYIVPSDTRSIEATLTGSVPVTFDVEPFPGDPDLSPAVPAPGVFGTQSGTSASLGFAPGGDVAPGLWYMNPAEIGPFGTAGAPAATASQTFTAVTPGFDPTVSPSTGDLWSVYQGLSAGFAPVYLQPGQSAEIPLTITPTAKPGATVSGEINVDDVFQYDVNVAPAVNGDELAALPYSYRVSH
jgi:hypothetical protein